MWPRYVSFGIIVLLILRYFGFSLTSMWHIFFTMFIIWYHLIITLFRHPFEIKVACFWHHFDIIVLIGIIVLTIMHYVNSMLIPFRHQCGLIGHHLVLFGIVL